MWTVHYSKTIMIITTVINDCKWLKYKNYINANISNYKYS